MRVIIRARDKGNLVCVCTERSAAPLFSRLSLASALIYISRTTGGKGGRVLSARVIDTPKTFFLLVTEKMMYGILSENDDGGK